MAEGCINSQDFFFVFPESMLLFDHDEVKAWKL